MQEQSLLQLPTQTKEKAQEEIQEGERKLPAVGLLDFPGQQGRSRALAGGSHTVGCM